MIKNTFLLVGIVFLKVAVAAETQDEFGDVSVATPTRLKQSIKDVPGSVTVISSETIKNFGLTSITDILRHVVGMEVTQNNGTTYKINYHGGNAGKPRRLNILVDGVSVYHPAVARVFWNDIPVPIENIERIEVARGPASATYGPNSMTAVINIITKHPDDVTAFNSSVVTGAGYASQFARVGWKTEGSQYYLSVTNRKDSGLDFVSNTKEDHDSSKVQIVNLRSNRRFSGGSFSFDAAVFHARNDVGFADNFQTTYPDQRVRDGYLNAILSIEQADNSLWKLQFNHAANGSFQSWQTCLPTFVFLPEMAALWKANPAYATAIATGKRPQGGTPADDRAAAAALAAIRQLGAGATAPTCGFANDDLRESRTDLELQNTVTVNNNLRAVWGIGLRREQATSQTFFAGSVGTDAQRVFGNIEYKIRDFTFNIANYFEDDRVSGSSNSPKIGINYALNQANTVRYLVTYGFRTPGLLEQKANWTYVLTGLSPNFKGSDSARIYQNAVSIGGLSHERILSREVGYLYTPPGNAYQADVKIFSDRFSSLISERLVLSDFNPTNNNSVTLRGIEGQGSIQLSRNFSVAAGQTFLFNNDATVISEKSQYSKSSGYFRASYRLSETLNLAFAYVGSSGDGLYERHYGREDLVISKTLRDQSSNKWNAALMVSRLDNRVLRDNPVALYNDRLKIRAQLGLTF